MKRSTTPFYGLSIFGGTIDDVLEMISTHMNDSREKKRDLLKIYTPNPEQFVIAWQDPVFQDVLSRGDLLLPDGAGLVWAVNRRQTNGHQLSRIAGRQVFHELLSLAAKNHWKVFLVGGRKGSAQGVIEKWGQADWEMDDGSKEDTGKVLQKIQASRPEIVFVAYGAPWQEKWIDGYQEQLVANGVRVAMVVGGAFDYESGRVSHVPLIVEKLSLEWLWRLIQEPWRWSRQLKGLTFFWLALRNKF